MEELISVQRLIKYAKVLQMRLDKKTYQEIGKELNITRERARQIEYRAVEIAKNAFFIQKALNTK